MGTVFLSPYTSSQAEQLGGTQAEPCQRGNCRSLTVRHRNAGRCFCPGFRLETLEQDRAAVSDVQAPRKGTVTTLEG